jgi:peptide/nickel transport system substrate-binding protein
VSTNYVMQKAWTETLEARVGDDSAAFLADPAEDVVYSGPYHKFFADDTKVVLVRNDNYWGQDASMWGKLPAPKYLAHAIFKDNAAGSVALAQGEVDVSQQFNSNVQICGRATACPSPPTCPSRHTASAPASRPPSTT